MKKIIISLLLFLVSPLLVSAADYEITDYYIESYILNNGNLQVKELFVMDGTFNGYERDLIYTNSGLSSDANDFANNNLYNANGISDVVIKAKYVDEVDFRTMNDLDFTEFTLVYYASNGDSAKYIASHINNGYRYRMYYPSNNDRVAFFLTYIIEDAVVIHNDVAELYWNFIGSDYADDLENVNIKIYLPGVDDSNNFRIWAHGGLTGDISYIEDDGFKTGLYAKIDKVNSHEPVDIRTTFDKSLIIDSVTLDHTNVNALEKIIAVETERANEANALREKTKTIYYITIGLNVTYLISLLIVFIYVVKKFGLDTKHNFDHEYNREFIDDYNVEVVNYLINKKNITPDAMSASIMNLIYNKNIKVEEIPGKNEKKKEYKLTLLHQENTNSTEDKLIGFLFNTVGKTEENGIKTFTTIELKKYASSTKTCETFVNKYTSWKNSVIEDGKNQGFYEKTKTAKVIGVIYLVLAIILFKLSFLSTILKYIVLIAGILFFIYTLVNTKKSTKGSLHYAKWMAFKRFLEDFGNFKEKELPEIVLWERYLVYATVFGIADKVENAMNVKIQEIPMYTNTNVYVNINISRDINRAITHSINQGFSKQAAVRAREAARSSSSSGSGFGGGFSSGGGFGGGGGGGRGF